MRTYVHNHGARWPGATRLAPAAVAIGSLVASMLTAGPAFATGSAAAPAGPALAAPSAATLAAAATPTRSHPTQASAHVVDHHAVRLVTGDAMEVSTWSDGRTTASLLPGSPSLGKPVQTATTGSDTYVVPKLPVRQYSQLDPSLFDITRIAALQRARGSVPLVVRFAKNATVHSLPGIHVDATTASRTPSGTLVARGSYTADATTGGAVAGSPPLTRSWRGVAEVSLPAPAVSPRKQYVLHTLTLNLLGRNGMPAPFGFAIVTNVQDGRLLNTAAFVIGGSVRLEVPAGPYSVLDSNFSSIVAKPDFMVNGDTTATLDERDATVSPTIQVKGNVIESLDTTVSRDSATHGGTSLDVSGLRHIRLSPVPAHLAHGRFVTEISGTLTTKKALHTQDLTGRLVYTKDIFHGVPSSIAIRHGRSDFAIVPHRYFANGPSRPSYLFVYPFTKYDLFAFILGVPITLGSSRTLWLQAGSDKTWLQIADAFTRFSPPEFAEMGVPFTSYTPGTSRPLNFLRGPVGPGLERGINANATGRLCLLCRANGLLRGNLPLFSSAGTSLQGFEAPGTVASWSLHSGRRTYGRGSGGIYPRLDLPASRRHYVLKASSHPNLGTWRLSTDVTDTWGFDSRAGKAVVPLLMPSYVPTNNVHGFGPSGRQHYRLDFDNLGPKAARITSATFEYSVFDHGGWRPAKLTRLDTNSFRVSYPDPYRAGRPYVSLRVTAKDAKGRTVTETALRAYRSRTSSGRVASSSASATDAGLTVARRPHRWLGQAHGATRACGPAKAHHARCFALIERRGSQAMAKSGDPRGYNAIDLRDAYGLNTVPTSGQTVAVVVAYDYPSAAADMNAYRRAFGLPRCTVASGCFTKINQKGETRNFPPRDQGWALEAALDLEMISAACPTCHIILAEGNSSSYHALNTANDAAVKAGARVTNHSFGGAEPPNIHRMNRHYNVAGVTAVAATGDYGYQQAQFPASSPAVVSVGGTVLRHALNARGWKERAWGYASSGCSAYFAKPAYQSDKACGMRTTADVSAVADSVAVYDTFLPRRYQGFVEVGGTSISSPFISGMIAAAGTGGLRPGDLYSRPRAFHDITKGSNGFCQGSYICTAQQGYDGPTGLGTPRRLATFQGTTKH